MNNQVTEILHCSFFFFSIRGRQISQTGQRDLDRIAAQVASKSSSQTN